MGEQAERLMFYSNVSPSGVRARAAEKLCLFAPEGLEQVFFCNSGAEANENALKLAIQQTGRKKIAALQGAFHGRTLLALAATANEKLRTQYRELLCPTVRLRPNVSEDVAQIDQTVAAVIVEPIQSMAGVVELSHDYLRLLRHRCDEVSALLIYDEIQTGMGRLGSPFAAGSNGVSPDIITLAKGMAGGMPMGAVLMTGHVGDKVGIGDLGTTFGGGPLVCAVLLAVLETIEKERLVHHAAELGALAHSLLRRGPVLEVLGRGCLLGLRFEGDSLEIQQELLRRGFIIGSSSNPQVLRLLPPINTPKEAITAFSEVLAELGG
jgi:acetylornithine/succinyldiaminopimelate/putrescine aminotransferase